MQSAPTVSVIIPTYNRADLLAEAILSVLAQTVPVHEIVVVDDGSTDSTLELLGDLACRVSNLKVVSIEHTPLVGLVRNAGVTASSGSVLAFLDSDDIWKPQRIEKQLRTWEQVPEAALGFCNLHCFNTNGLVAEGPFLGTEVAYGGRILGELLEEPIVVPSTMMVWRAVFDSLGPFTSGVIVEDYEFILEVAARYPVSYVPEVLVLMRDHSGGRARQREELSMLEYLRIVRRFQKRHPEITSGERAQARRGLANVHFKLSQFYMERGDRALARRHLAAMARLRPWDRRLPAALALAVSPRSATLTSKP
jgi:glycosyltransferase involved in cell wall biosynthesis